MECSMAAVSNDYFEFIAEYNGVLESVKERFQTDCVLRINNRFSVAYVPQQGKEVFESGNYPYNAVPRCFGLMDTAVLEDTGTAQVRRSNLDLYGNGVMVGIIDTGIDYQNPVFQYADQTTKIETIWDQTIEDETRPFSLGYGTEYSKEEIEEAIRSEDPSQIVPSVDSSGHGTFLAGMIAGSEESQDGFSGIAPNVRLSIVKLRQAKPHLKEYYCMDPSYEAYSETDIMLGVYYITQVAERLQMPVILYLGLGTSQGSHLGTGPLDQYLAGMAPLKGVGVVASAGNEGQARHHYSGEAGNGSVKVEVKTGSSEYGFTMELWGMAPNGYYVDIESPSGQRTGRIAGGRRGRRKVNFLLERTNLSVDYFTVDSSAGAPGIIMRFLHPAEGVWNIYVSDDKMGSREFDLWLPVANFLSEDTFFLESSPYNTLVSPGNTELLMCASNYNQNNGSIYIDSSRGFPRNTVKPDFSAPGVEVYGPLPRNRFGRKTGSSVSGAVTAGIAALIMEWGYVKGNDLDVNTTRIKNYLIRGARREDGRIYPSREWGYGIVDLYETFLRIR